MVFAAVLQHQRAAAREARNQRQRLNKQINRLEKDRQLLADENKQLRGQISWSNKFDDYFHELVIARRENENLRKKVAGLTENSKIGAEIQRLLENEQLESKSPEEIIREAKSIEQAQEILTKAGLGESGHSSGHDFAKSVKELVDTNRRLEGQVANLERRSGPGGTEMPPCWVTSTGEIQYVFDVELTNNAAGGRIIVHDSSTTGHDQERAQLFRALKFEQSLRESDFLDETQPFYAFGKAQKPECRFFVRVIDNTGSNEKELFKSLLGTVERHFYKRLMPNSIEESTRSSQPANTELGSSDD